MCKKINICGRTKVDLQFSHNCVSIPVKVMNLFGDIVYQYGVKRGEKMRKKFTRCLLIGFSVLFLSFGLCTNAHAYTEEEKQQAKAWLSAHGYSPDAGGASQAYQDYLNGKFDEELGRNTTEDTSGQSGDTRTTEESVATQEDGEAQAQDNGAAHTQDNSSTANGKVSEETKTSEQNEQTAKEDSAQGERNTSGAAFSVSASDPGSEGDDAQPDKTETSTAEGQDIDSEDVNDEETSADGDEEMVSEESDKRSEGISLYRSENKDTYKEAGLVIALSVLLVAVFKAVMMLLR